MVRRLVGVLIGVLVVGLLTFASPSLAEAESLEISHGANPTQNVPLSITVSGVADGHHNLYVVVHESDEACATYPDFETGTHLASGENLSAGSYSEEYSFTPPQPGVYTICGYVDEAEYTTPDATGSGSFTAGTPAGSVSVSINPAATENGAVSIRVSGSIEVPRKLYVVVHAGAEACAKYPDFEIGTHLASGESLGAGSYDKEWSFTPNATTTYTVCGYLDEAEYTTPDATGSGTFTNVTPQTRAEEAKRAAEQAAQEAAHAAEAKKLAEYLQGVAERGHCGELSYEYDEGDQNICKADEAAIAAATEAKWNSLRATELSKSVGSLVVRVAAHPGKSSQHPGYTSLRIVTTPFAYVTIRLSRYGHRTEHYEAWPNALTSRMVTLEQQYTWTCSRPGGTYTYTITARTKTGHTLTKKGRFSPVSVARCNSLKRSEQEAHERASRRYEEEIQRQREAEEARRHEGESNCRSEGGTVVAIYEEGEPRVACRAPNGGLLPWIP